MRDVVDAVQAWSAKGVSSAIATVVDVRRSAPRPPGSKMAVNSSGEVVAAVSGGCVEGAVVQVAEEVLRGAPPRLLHFGIADEEAWDVGLPCGGEIDVWVEEYRDPEQVAFAQLAVEQRRGALVTDLTSGRRILVLPDGTTLGTLGDPRADARARAHADDLVWSQRSELATGCSWTWSSRRRGW